MKTTTVNRHRNTFYRAGLILKIIEIIIKNNKKLFNIKNIQKDILKESLRFVYSIGFQKISIFLLETSTNGKDHQKLSNYLKI